jgi:CRP/FNR family transcriptional regulator, polysaccharide utilization system transcription regulator
MKNELYANLSSHVQRQLADQERSATVSPGSKLIQFGVSPNQLIILNSGLAEITVPIAGKPVSLGTVGPGKVLGLRSIMCGEVPEVDVTCLEDCDITLVSCDVFLEVLRRNPEMYFAVAKVLSADLKMAQAFLREKTNRGKTLGTLSHHQFQ